MDSSIQELDKSRDREGGHGQYKLGSESHTKILARGKGLGTEWRQRGARITAPMGTIKQVGAPVTLLLWWSCMAYKAVAWLICPIKGSTVDIRAFLLIGAFTITIPRQKEQ